MKKNNKVVRNRDPRGIAAHAILKNYKNSAEERKLSFSLTEDQFKSFIFNDCTYCGRPPSNNYKRATGELVPYNGIDRKDSQLGYFYENCITCCFRCNQMKSSLDSETFIEIAHKIVSNQKIKNQMSEKKLNYYYDRAIAVSKASPDLSTKVGALLIHGESGAVIAEGYNGYIRGAPDSRIPTTRPEKYDYTIHAEMNLICNAVRHGISTDKCVVFCTISPCVKCMRALYQAGITRVYVRGFYSDFDQSSSMLDLNLTVTKLGEFCTIDAEPRES